LLINGVVYFDAVNKVAKMKKEKMTELTAGIPLPAGFQMPF
jgi:DNA-binding protein YbaB